MTEAKELINGLISRIETLETIVHAIFTNDGTDTLETRMRSLEKTQHKHDCRLNSLELGDIPSLGGMHEFINILFLVLSNEQMDTILQAILDRHLHGMCPICKGENDSHDIDCPICLILEMKDCKK